MGEVISLKVDDGYLMRKEDEVQMLKTVEATRRAGQFFVADGQ